MEADLDGKLLENRGEHGTATLLGVAVTLFLGSDLLALLLHAGQLGRRSREYDATTAVADGESGGSLRRSIDREFGDDRLQSCGFDVGNRDHRRAVSGTDDAAAAADETCSSTHELGDHEEARVLRTVGCDGFGGDEPLRVSDDLDRRGLGGIESLQLQCAQGCDLSEEHSGKRHGSGGQRSLGRAVRTDGVVVGEVLFEHPADRVETDRAHDQQLVGNGRESDCSLVDEIGQFGFERGVASQFLEGAEPRCTLSTEGQCVRLARGETICQSPRAAIASRGFVCVAGASRASSV